MKNNSNNLNMIHFKLVYKLEFLKRITRSLTFIKIALQEYAKNLFASFK